MKSLGVVFLEFLVFGAHYASYICVCRVFIKIGEIPTLFLFLFSFKDKSHMYQRTLEVVLQVTDVLSYFLFFPFFILDSFNLLCLHS